MGGCREFLLECAAKAGVEGAAEFLEDPNNGVKEVRSVPLLSFHFGCIKAAETMQFDFFFLVCNFVVALSNYFSKIKDFFLVISLHFGIEKILNPPSHNAYIYICVNLCSFLFHFSSNEPDQELLCQTKKKKNQELSLLIWLLYWIFLICILGYKVLS